MGPDIRPEILRCFVESDGPGIAAFRKLRSDLVPINGYPQQFFTPAETNSEVNNAKAYVDRKFRLRQDFLADDGMLIPFNQFVAEFTSQPSTSRSLTAAYLNFVNGEYAFLQCTHAATLPSDELSLRKFLLNYDIYLGTEIGSARMLGAEEYLEDAKDFDEAITEGIATTDSLEEFGVAFGVVEETELFLSITKLAQTDAAVLGNNDPTGTKLIDHFLYEVTDLTGQSLASDLRADTGPYRAGKQLFADLYRLLQPEFARLIA